MDECVIDNLHQVQPLEDVVRGGDKVVTRRAQALRATAHYKEALREEECCVVGGFFGEAQLKIAVAHVAREEPATVGFDGADDVDHDEGDGAARHGCWDVEEVET